MLLYQRGLLVLHASSVSIARRCVTFLGPPRRGKSTLAAVLYARGHGLVADDVTALHVDGSPILAPPAYPRLRLSPQTLRLLGEDPDKLPRARPGSEKRVWPAERNFPACSLPVHAVFALYDGDRVAITPLQPQHAIVELIRHSFFRRRVTPPDAPRHLRQCARVVEAVPVLRLSMPRSLPAVRDAALLIEKYAQT